MSADELGRTYSALSEAIGRVGPQRTPLFLATLGLALLARHVPSSEALQAIADAERLAVD